LPAGHDEGARRNRKEAGGRTLPRLADTAARLVCFTVLTRTRRGRTKTAAVRVLTTLLDPDALPAAQIAALYAARWQAETAFLHLKKIIRGAGRVPRGRSYPKPHGVAPPAPAPSAVLYAYPATARRCAVMTARRCR
jgi:hypothetical protein